MKNTTIILLLLAGIAVSSCQNQGKSTSTDSENPFFTEYTTPFQVPPFEQIKLEHFMPAIDEGVLQQEAEIKAIVENQDEPTFENTILAFDNSGELLSKVNSVFGPLNSSVTNDEMQALAREISPKQTRHRDNIMLNPVLFQRIKAVYEKRNDLGLDEQQLRLVEKYFQDFERNGANLSEEDQTKLRTLNEELSKLLIKFSENVLAETNRNFRLVVASDADLKGRPQDVIVRAAEQAKKDSMEGKWGFTLDQQSMLPFLQFAENSELLEKLYRCYFLRGDNDNEFHKKEVNKQLVKLGQENKIMMGFKNVE